MSTINTEHKPKYTISSKPVSKILLSIQVIVSFLYLYIVLFALEKANIWLFIMLALSQIFHVWLILTLVYTIWPRKVKNNFSLATEPKADIYITVVNEPVSIVRKTVQACKNINYDNKSIYILNDGRVCNHPDWEAMEKLAHEQDINCISRTVPGGAKAGNINNALKQTSGEIVVVFDADHAPYSNFLEKTIGYFVDSKVAFVQTPQYYKNFVDNEVTLGSAEQQELFFGPIMYGKNALNSAFMCGTNMLIRRKALEEVGGLCETNIAEDFMTSFQIHEKGWKSVYVPTVLAEGLAPEDFLSYSKQQFRWARGSMEILFWHNPIFNKGLSPSQKLSYLISASYYLSGLAVVVNLITPVIYLYTGLEPVKASSMLLPSMFLPHIVFSVMILNLCSNSAYTFKALSFSGGSFWIFCKALFSVIFRIKTSFAVTSKQKLSGNFVHLVIPHLIYATASIAAIVFAYNQSGLIPAVLTNASWIVFNILTFVPFILSSLPSDMFDKVRVFSRANAQKSID
jgi:cellulose synthase (UDP-forming)